MGEMSSIVSRRPPVSGSVSHANERRWMSMRLGTSRGLSRRAKLRRVRGAATEAKAADSSGRTAGWGEIGCTSELEARPAKIAQGIDTPVEVTGAHGPRPGRAPYVAGSPAFGRLRLSAGRRGV